MKSLFNFGFSKIQCGTLYFLLVFLLALGFQLRDSAVAALPLCHASHNMGIFQTVLVQIALQVRVKIAQFAAVKNIISTDFAALFVLQIFLDRNKAEMQMRLAALVIMDDGLYDIFFPIAICHEIVCGTEKIVIAGRV